MTKVKIILQFVFLHFYSSHDSVSTFSLIHSLFELNRFVHIYIYMLDYSRVDEKKPWVQFILQTNIIEFNRNWYQFTNYLSHITHSHRYMYRFILYSDELRGRRSCYSIELNKTAANIQHPRLKPIGWIYSV